MSHTELAYSATNMTTRPAAMLTKKSSAFRRATLMMGCIRTCLPCFEGLSASVTSELRQRDSDDVREVQLQRSLGSAVCVQGRHVSLAHGASPPSPAL